MKILPIHEEALGSLSRCLLSQSRLLLSCYYAYMWHIVGCYIGKWVWVNSSKQEVAPSVLAMNIWNGDFPGWKKIYLRGFWSVSQEYDRYFYSTCQTPNLCLRNLQPNFRQAIMSKNSESVGKCWGRGKTIVSSESRLVCMLDPFWV